MKTIILASNNKDKLREFRSLFPDYEILSLKEIGYTEDIIEDGETFSENAYKKAYQVARDCNIITISDDSGLEVEALNNEPGVHSARYAGNHDDEANNQLLIKNLKGIENRRAAYVCAICVCHPDGEYRVVEGRCEGLIVDTPKGTGGFGYDPYFYVSEFNDTMASITLEQKNMISHRAKAIRMMLEVCNEDFSFKR